MPVPSSISDLSTTPSLNSPAGTESPSTVDDYLRTHAAFIKQADDKATGAVKATDLSAPGGSALVGYNANRTAKSKLDEQALTPLDFAHLAATVSAKYPGTPGSYLFLSFKSWLPAIQAAIDAASAAGGGTVLIPKHTEPFYINDAVELKSNVTLVFEDWVILADTSTNGAGIVGFDAENVTINNILLDCSTLNAGGTGENGLGVVKGKNIRVNGGRIKNCRAGTTIPMLGGKAIQVEASGTTGFVADGVHIQDSDVAMSSMRDGSGASPQMSGVEFTNIKAYDCGILLWVNQTNIGANRGNGLEQTVQLTNFYARNCGTNEGVLQFGGSGNVNVSDGIVIMDDAAGPQALIRGSHNNCTFSNIDFYANTNAVIDLDISDNGFGTYPNENNRYDIRVLGTVNYLVDAAPTTTDRVLLGCDGRFILKNDVASAFFGAELRNGTSTFDITHNERTVRISTVYGNGSTGVVKKFSDLPNEGPNIPQLFTQALTFPATQKQSADPNTLDDYEENGTTAVTLTDTSGGTLLATGTADYTKIGRMVFVSLSVTWPTTSETFTARISGLPFPSGNNGGRAMVGFALRYTDAGAPVSVTLNPSSTEMLFVSSAGAVMTNANLSGKTVSGLLTYMAAT